MHTVPTAPDDPERPATSPPPRAEVGRSLLDDVAQAVELLANLSREDRRAVLAHFHAELTAGDYLPGGGMASGAMVVTETSPEADPATPPRSGGHDG